MNFNLDESIGFIISKTSAKMKYDLSQSFKTYDITTEQWGFLNRLWEKDGISQKELSEKNCKDQPNTTRILDKMEKKGLVKREPHPSDRRAVLIYLTEAGHNLKEVLVPLAIESLERSLWGIDREEQEQLRRWLNLICNNLS